MDMSLQRGFQARDSTAVAVGVPPPGTATDPVVEFVPAVHQHLLHTRHVEVVLLAGGSIAPASPLSPTSD